MGNILARGGAAELGFEAPADSPAPPPSSSGLTVNAAARGLGRLELYQGFGAVVGSPSPPPASVGLTVGAIARGHVGLYQGFGAVYGAAPTPAPPPASHAGGWGWACLPMPPRKRKKHDEDELIGIVKPDDLAPEVVRAIEAAPVPTITPRQRLLRLSDLIGKKALVEMGEPDITFVIERDVRRKKRQREEDILLLMD